MKFLITTLLLALVAVQSTNGQKLYAARQGTKYGYIDPAGNWIIQPAFSSAKAFSDSLARIKYPGSTGYWGYINTKGELVIKPQFLKTKNFVNGFAQVKKK